MVYSVSVRDCNELERKLGAEEALEIPEECKRNSDVIYHVLHYADRLIPSFKELSNEEVRTIADSVAYLMRPDLLKNGNCYGPSPVFEAMGEFIMIGEEENEKPEIHLKNNPDDIVEGWELPRESPYTAIGAELFRCYGATMAWAPSILEKVSKDGAFSVAFPLADLSAYLLNTSDLTDYSYTPEEVNGFHTTLAREMREI